MTAEPPRDERPAVDRRPWHARWCLCEPRPPMVKPVEKCDTCSGLRVRSGLPQRVGETRISNGIAVTRTLRGFRLGPAVTAEHAEGDDDRRA
jgi:hypothetical protein